MTDATPRRLLNHVELVYRPGERPLAKRVFELLGFHVLSDTGEFMVICADPSRPNGIDNVCYASEITPEQWAFEQTLAIALEEPGQLSETHALYLDLLRRVPQRAFHFGVHTGAREDLYATVDRVKKVEETDPELAGRISVSGVWEPGDEGSFATNIVQSFYHTDVVSSGLLTIGQHFELHWYSDTPPAM